MSEPQGPVFEVHCPQSLASTVDKLIYFKHFTPPSARERLVPSVSLFLVIELDGMTRQLLDNETGSVVQEVKGGWVSGLQTQYRTISAHDQSEMLAVQFHALGAARFLPLPLSDYENRVVPAELVFGSPFAALRQSLLEAPSATEKFLVMERWLQSRQVAEPSSVEALTMLVHDLRLSPSSSISSLVEAYPASHRQFIADFKKYVGTKPKFFQRIVRFEFILASIEQKKTVDWSELAYQWGFSDQAHLVREFVFFSGFVPTEFVGRDLQNSGTNFFPLVKKLQDGGPISH